MEIEGSRGGLSWRAALAAGAGPLAALVVAVPWLVAPGGVGFDHFIHRKVVLGWLDAWRHGVAWPAYIDTPNSGIGSFWPSYYPPFYHATTAAAMAVGLDYWRACMAAMLVSQVGGSLLCYAWLRGHASRASAAWGSVAFAMAPYTVFNDYVRGAFPEGFAIAWLPGVFLGIDGVRERWGWRAAAPGIVAFALIALGNLPAMVVAGVATACYLATDFLASRRWDHLVRGLFVPALGLGISAFSWMSAWLDSGLVDVPTGGSDVRTNPSCRHYLYYGTFNRGLFDWMLYGLAYFLMATSIVLFLASRRDGGKVSARALGLALAACGLFFCGNSSSPFYLCLPVLHYAQFPWRFLGVLAPAVALLVAASGRGPGIVPRVVATLGLAAVLGFDLLVYRDSYATELLRVPADESGSLGEFLPHGCSSPTTPGPVPRAEVRSGRATVEIERWMPGFRQVSVRSSGPASLVLATYEDSRWVARDQSGSPLETARGDVIGRIAVDIPAGTTRVTLELTPSDNARLAQGLTILCLVNIGVMALFSQWAGSRRPPSPSRPETGSTHERRSHDG